MRRDVSCFGNSEAGAGDEVDSLLVLKVGDCTPMVLRSSVFIILCERLITILQFTKQEIIVHNSSFDIMQL